MRGIGRIKRIISAARRKITPQAAILMYHRVIDLPVDPFNIAVSPDNFAQQMEHIKRYYTPVSLPELVEGVKKNSIPRKAVVVTFDDGYFDNYAYAHPILEANQVPWTLFATTNLIGSRCDTWWDELTHVMVEKQDVPEKLQLTFDGQTHEWSTVTAEERLAACFGVHPFLLPMNASDRNESISRLFEWAGIERTPRSEYRMMTQSELEEVTKSDYFNLGGHTINHPYLSSLSKEEQLKEIMGGRKELQEKYNQSINTFAYPYGNYSSETIEAVKEAGFEAAVTVHATNVETNWDMFMLGRYQVYNWHIDQFSQMLKAVF